MLICHNFVDRRILSLVSSKGGCDATSSTPLLIPEDVDCCMDIYFCVKTTNLREFLAIFFREGFGNNNTISRLCVHLDTIKYREQ